MKIEKKGIQVRTDVERLWEEIHGENEENESKLRQTLRDFGRKSMERINRRKEADES